MVFRRVYWMASGGERESQDGILMSATHSTPSRVYMMVGKQGQSEPIAEIHRNQACFILVV